jgi:hypothetical protein
VIVTIFYTFCWCAGSSSSGGDWDVVDAEELDQGGVTKLEEEEWVEQVSSLSDCLRVSESRCRKKWRLISSSRSLSLVSLASLGLALVS